MGKVRVAVIGCGHLGKWHVEKAISRPFAELVAIVEGNEEGARRAQELFPDQRTVVGLDEIINEIDAAIVATPTASHHGLLKILIQHDKHVFCEKPMTATLSEALQIEEMIKGRQLVFQVGHSERFHQIWDERDRYPEFFKETGTVRINRMAPFKGRATDVDVVQDLMIHDLDLICHLFGEEPCSVQAVGHKIRTDKWDYVSGKFAFGSGRDAFITVARNHIREVRDIEITNKHGCFYIDLFKREVLLASSDSESVDQHSYPQRDHLMIEQEHFYNSILNNEPAVVDLKDGVIAVRLVEKVMEALQSGGTIELA